MKQIILLVLALTFIGSVDVLALTADDIHIYQIEDEAKLEIVVRNPTREPRKDYIKKIEVYIDNNKPVYKTFNFQRGPSQRFKVSVPDIENILKIRVKAYPNGGREAEKDFVKDDIEIKKRKKAISGEDSSY